MKVTEMVTMMSEVSFIVLFIKTDEDGVGDGSVDHNGDGAASAAADDSVMTGFSV